MAKKTQFGKKLKKARLNAGFTQQQLAEKVGVLYQHIGRWERGEVDPTAEKIMLLANALEIKANDLFDIGSSSPNRYLVSEQELEEKIKLIVQEELNKRMSSDKK